MIKAYSDSVKFVCNECPMVFSLVEAPIDNKYKADVFIQLRSRDHNPTNIYMTVMEVEALHKLCENYLQTNKDKEK